MPLDFMYCLIWWTQNSNDDKKNTTHNRLTMAMLRMMNETRYITYCSVDLNARIGHKYRPFFASINFFQQPLLVSSSCSLRFATKKNNNNHRPHNSLCAIKPIIFALFFFCHRFLFPSLSNRLLSRCASGINCTHQFMDISKFAEKKHSIRMGEKKMNDKMKR